MKKGSRSILHFIHNPPNNSVLKRFVRYARSQSITDDRSLSRRQKYLLQKFDLFTYREEFQQKIKLLRNKLRIPTGGFSTFDEVFSFIQTLNEKSLIDYEKRVADIHKSLYIDRRWLELVEYWLWRGVIDINNLIPDPVKIEYFDDPLTGKPELFLRIYPDTQQKDVTDSWGMIEKYQGLGMVMTSQAVPQSEFKNIRSQTRSGIIRKENKKDRVSKERVIKAQKRALELQQEGKDYKQIARILNDEKLTKGCGYGDVGNLIRRFKLIVHKTQLD